MKFCIVICFLMVITHLANSKDIEKKSPIKKATLQKPTKTPKNVVEEFKELPPDDIEFIKQLDKQFKIHGENIKIKIENPKPTNTTKNSKRTIDGELGYGSYNNDLGHGYQFSKPKFMIYPYSQEDIPPTNNNYRQQSHGQYNNQINHSKLPVSQYYGRPPPPPPPSNIHQHRHTSIIVQPSQAFELKEINHGYNLPSGYIQQNPHGQYQTPLAYESPNGAHPLEHTVQQQQQQQQYSPEPVIVLRIPGPTKYAQHLQALLQQYLELRAAQYIQELQAQEAHGQNIEEVIHNVDHHQQQQQQQQQYITHLSPVSTENNGGGGGHQAAQEAYSTSGEAEQSQTVYEGHEEVSSVDHIQNQQALRDQQQQIIYQYQQQMYQHQDNVAQYQNDQFADQQPHLIYGPASSQSHEEIEHHVIQQQQQQLSDVPSIENYPRSTHTQAYISSTPSTLSHSSYQPSQEPQHYQQQQQQQQSQIIVQENAYPQEQQHDDESYQNQQYNAPLPQPFQSSQQQQQQQQQPHTLQIHQAALPDIYYRPSDEEYASASEKTISITQRSPTQQQKSPITPSDLKRGPPFTEEQFKKFNKLINRLKKKSTLQKSIE